jgi:hypothetical protein
MPCLRGPRVVRRASWTVTGTARELPRLRGCFGRGKWQIQAFDPPQLGLLTMKGRSGTVTYDYIRRRTTTLFAALNVLDRTVLGQSRARHRHRKLIRFFHRVEVAVLAGTLAGCSISRPLPPSAQTRSRSFCLAHGGCWALSARRSSRRSIAGTKWSRPIISVGDAIQWPICQIPLRLFRALSP